MRRWMLGILLLAATLGGVVTAQADYVDGQRAWDAGRHSEALREWQASANAGDAKAMLALGRLYMQGLGVPQNYVQAHMWFSLAASRFEAEAMKERDALATRMAPEQIAAAQKLAASWRPGETQPAASATRKPASPPPPKAIREAQQLLAALGYEPDSPDGQWGERTAEAYRAFVRDANLPVTDTLTPAALKTMRAMARQAGAVSTPKAALPPDALHRAAKAGNLKGLEAALSAGADVNARDDKGWTALMYVVDKGYVLLVEPLMQAKADLDVRAPDGATALFMAVAHGHSEVITKLMKAGADPTIKGPKEKTATELAQARKGELNQYASEIEALLAGKTWDDHLFEWAQLRVEMRAYSTYLKNFPQGRHAVEARDSEAFFRADSLGTVEAYSEYIVSHPTGRHIAEARRRQAERKRPSVSLTATSPAGMTGRECDQCPKMVVVPAGRFLMGYLPLSDYEAPRLNLRSEEAFLKELKDRAIRSGAKTMEDLLRLQEDMQRERAEKFEEWSKEFQKGVSYGDEIPVHQVTIAAPFAVGKYEVTFAEWDACVAGGGCAHRPDDKGWGRGTQPVDNVSWNDAQEYVRWLSRETGQPYRLLSEAEWEYVARAGTTTKYWWGNEADHDFENYEGHGGADRWKAVSLVGSLKPNAFGLYDIAGNVREWVEDCWHENYQGAPSDGSAWTSEHCGERVERGGHYLSDPGDIRSAVRKGDDPGDRSGLRGFRVARTLD